MDRFTFTRSELYTLLDDTIRMYEEYRGHGYEDDQARAAAGLEVVGGLDAEDELHALGECATTHAVREVAPC